LPRDRVGDLVNSGEVTPGEIVSGWSNVIIDRGIPFSRIYDPVEELGRLRQIYAARAGMRPRPAGALAFRQNRSLRRV
jgi:hypothetical protein